MRVDRLTMAHLRINERQVDLTGADPTESLLRLLRRARLLGTKEGCGDGDCGACTVALVETDQTGAARFVAVNSCLLPIGVLAGREIFTVEALANGDTLHPVQQALVDHAGSQCGYCTPGFAMSLFCGYYNGEFDDHVIDGNLCRCTGYVPIRRAAAALAKMPRPEDRFSKGLADRARKASTLDMRVAGNDTFAGFLHPTSIDEALALKVGTDAAWFAGGTDLGVNLSRGQRLAPTLIAIDRIAELHTLEIADGYVRIGSVVPLTRLETELAGLFPALDEMLPWFAARQVKNRATLGGNLGSASPIGDLLPWLLAHDAVIEVRGPNGARDLPIASYFKDYRKTALDPNELIVAVRVPRLEAIQAAYKVAKRQTDDISIVAAVFVLVLDAGRRVRHVRLAFGGVAAVPIRALDTEAWLLGRALDAEIVGQASARLREEFSPLDDHRGSAAYRRALVGNLFARFVAERL